MIRAFAVDRARAAGLTREYTMRVAVPVLVGLLVAAPASALDQLATELSSQVRDRYVRISAPAYVLRNVTLVDGTGAPPQGPVDIVIEDDRIAEIRSVGYPLVEINEGRRPQGATREIDASGMFVMPGFVDMHVHTGGSGKAPQAEYTYKLWMGHGVTTTRGVGHGPMMWALEQKALSERNEIVAPRMFTYARPGEAWDEGPIDSPEKAREWVRWAANVEVDGARIDGLKLTSYPPAIMEALIDEAHRHGLTVVAHSHRPRGNPLPPMPTYKSDEVMQIAHSLIRCFTIGAARVPLRHSLLFFARVCGALREQRGRAGRRAACRPGWRPFIIHS